MQKTNKISAPASVAYLIIGMLFIAAGNGLTVAAKTGSAFWTAASVNLSNYFPLSLGTTTVILGFVALFLNVVIIRSFDLRQAIVRVIYMIFFGHFMNLFTHLFASWGIELLPFTVRIVLAAIGIFVLACGVSVYQRVHVVVHPIDELMHTMRFVLCKGDAFKGQIASFIPPIIISLVMWGITGRLYAIHVGTAIALLFQGQFVGLADQHVFKHLKHRYIPYTHGK